MKTILYGILFISLFSCYNNSDNDNNDKDTIDSISSSNLEANSTASPEAPTETFSKMPLLATYINELPSYNGQFPINQPAKYLALRADTIHFLNQEEDGDYSNYYELNHFTQQQAQFKGGWYNTSGSKSWHTTYQLLNKNEAAPIVLLAMQSKETFGGYQEDLEFNFHDLKELIKAGNKNIPTEEDALFEIAKSMTNIDIKKSSLYDDHHVHDLRFWVWQKQDGQWKNISSKVFQPEMYTKLEASFPFLVQKKVDSPIHPGFFLAEKMYSKEGLAQNKANWKHWLGVEELDKVSFDLAIDTKTIQFKASENKALHWDWDGERFTLNNLPKPITWKDEPCLAIDYSSNKKYSFVGNISKIPIQMEISLNNGKIQGEYWYTNSPHNKFPVEGSFEASTETKLDFYRIKNNQQREWFNGYFSNCEFKGWWQHQGTMATEEFSLKLVQE
jgi:hypothetical protein